MLIRRGGICWAPRRVSCHVRGGPLKSKLFTASFSSAALFVALLVLTAAPAKSQGAGEQVYKTKCTSCHGADGAGATPAGKATKARDFCSDEVKKETDEEWMSIIGKGKNKMSGYDKKLTSAEVKDVIAHIRGLCKK